MSHFKFSSPLLRGFTHSQASVGTSVSTILAGATTPERRVSVIVQNQHATAVIEVILAETGSDGLLVQPNESISLDNYNGIIRCISDTAATPVHIAYATA
jgi:uncharacterized protein (DUF111 family)